MPFFTTVMKITPSSTPKGDPSPPRSEHPPMTAAAIDCSGNSPPSIGSPEETRAVSSQPAKAVIVAQSM